MSFDAIILLYFGCHHSSQPSFTWYLLSPKRMGRIRKKKRKGKSKNRDYLLAKYLLVPPSLGL